MSKKKPHFAFKSRQIPKLDAFLYLSLFLTSILKIYYGLSRNIFESGPDADTYMLAIKDFARKSFFSPDIQGMPIWPSGYPWLLSFFYKISLENWTAIIQIFQVICFGIGTLLFKSFVSRLVNPLTASLSSLFLIFNPAWFVANVECMYETLLFFFVTLGVHLISRPKDKNINLFITMCGYLVIGFSIVIHPRIIIVYLLFIILSKNRVEYLRLNTLLPFAIFPAFFAVRNFIAENKLTLSDAIWPAMNYGHPSLVGCQSINCVFSNIFDSPIEYLKESLINTLYFFSPHSGPLERGTWFHNIAFYPGGLDIFMSLVLVTLPLFLIVLGLDFKKINSASIDFFALSSYILFAITDVLVYGDNRHRLIAQIFVIHIQTKGFLKISKILFRRNQIKE